MTALGDNQLSKEHMMRKAVRLVGFAAVTATAAACMNGTAAAYTLKVLYSFCAQTYCSDGQAPMGDLAVDSRGNLFGTTADGGGPQGHGVVFELNRDRKGQKWVYKRLYAFCRHGNPCTDGVDPVGHLVVATNGDLYGAARFGGAGGGTIFRLSRATGRWALTTLYAFCGDGGSCSDGTGPESGLTYVGAASGAPYDGISTLYGTANGGSGGVAYQIAPGSKGWRETVIYSFCSLTNCTDGQGPDSPLLADASGNLFGTTLLGGRENTGGTVFELEPKRKYKWDEVVLHSFCQPYPCTTGTLPAGGLAMDGNGDLLGTTESGGTGTGGYESEGVLFRLTPNRKQSQYSVLYNFCSQPNCADGASPGNGVVLGHNGGIFGVTQAGGNLDPASNQTSGVAFRQTGSQYQVIYSFCSEQPNCTDGFFPSSNLSEDKNGNLFGMTEQGGTFNGGAVYELSP